MTVKMFCALSLLSPLIFPLVCGFTQAPPQGAEPTPRQAPAVEDAIGVYVWLDAIIYQVRMPTERIAQLDVGKLMSQSATPVDLQKALAALGTATPLYLVNQPIQVGGKHEIMLGSNVPFESARSVKGGQPTSMIEYKEVGARLNITSSPVREGSAERFAMQIAFELSAVDPSAIELGGGAKAPLFRKVKQSIAGAVDVGRALIFANVDGATPDADGKVTAYVTTIHVRPQAER